MKNKGFKTITALITECCNNINIYNVERGSIRLKDEYEYEKVYVYNIQVIYG